MGNPEIRDEAMLVHSVSGTFSFSVRCVQLTACAQYLDIDVSISLAQRRSCCGWSAHNSYTLVPGCSVGNLFNCRRGHALKACIEVFLFSSFSRLPAKVKCECTSRRPRSGWPHPHPVTAKSIRGSLVGIPFDSGRGHGLANSFFLAVSFD